MTALRPEEHINWGDLLVKKLDPQAQLPTKSYPDDAGFDLYTSKVTVIPPHSTVDVPCDIAVQLPGESWGLLIGRSSTAHTRHLMVITSVIDNGFEGSLFAMVWNMWDHEVVIEVGDRIAQLVIMSASMSPRHSRAKEVKEFLKRPKSDGPQRGTHATGSSGQ